MLDFLKVREGRLDARVSRAGSPALLGNLHSLGGFNQAIHLLCSRVLTFFPTEIQGLREVAKALRCDPKRCTRPKHVGWSHRVIQSILPSANNRVRARSSVIGVFATLKFCNNWHYCAGTSMSEGMEWSFKTRLCFVCRRNWAIAQRPRRSSTRRFGLSVRRHSTYTSWIEL